MIITDWNKQSDVCLVLSNVGISISGHAWYCLDCKGSDHRTPSTKKFLAHIKYHRDRGDTVPAGVEAMIKAVAKAHTEGTDEREDSAAGNDTHRSEDIENLKRLAEESAARNSSRVHKEP